MINSFKNEYEFLSNFYVLEVPITMDGLVFTSVEAAYQASKTLDLSLRESFQNLEPGQSKKLGRKLELREDWEAVKIPIMTDLVRQKFQNNPELARKLLATRKKVLLEGNWCGDQFWGVDSKTLKGENHLGKILMKIRTELNTHTIYMNTTNIQYHGKLWQKIINVAFNKSNINLYAYTDLNFTWLDTSSFIATPCPIEFMKMFPNLSVNTGFKIAHLDKPIIVLTDDVKEIKEVLRDSNLNVDQWSIILPLSMYNEALNNTYKRNIYWANDYNVNAIVNQIIKE